MNALEKISHETMVFMRGKYCLDEIGDGKDELKFKQGKKTVLTVYTHENCFTFLIIFGPKGISECKECGEFPCIKATSADYRSMLHNEVHYADEITWGILPYVPWQYEKR